MPISHLLSDSFYVEQMRQHDQDQAISTPAGAYRSSSNGDVNTRHVRFDDNFTNTVYFNGNQVWDNPQRSNAETHFSPTVGAHTRFEPLPPPKGQKVPTTNFETDGFYPCINYENLHSNVDSLQVVYSFKMDELVTYVCQSSERKVTKKVALNGYAYTKRGGKGGVSYWYCDQRKICSASLIEKQGAFSVGTKADNTDGRTSKRGWGSDGLHETHPRDNDRINKEISTRNRRLERRKRVQENRAAKTKENGTNYQACTEKFDLTVENHSSVPHPHAKISSFDETAEENGDYGDDYSIRIENVRGHDLWPEDISNSSIQNANGTSTDAVIPVLIDMDGGFYDAWALSLALTYANKAEKFKIVGITTVNGCTTVDNAIRNIGRVLHTIGGNAQSNLVFKGMDSPLLCSKSKTPRPAFFGSDGFGDVLPPPGPEQEQKVVLEHGVNAIIKFAEKYKGRLVVLALGPLTNLAMAVKLKPEMRNYVKEIFIVGGNSEGVGNVTVCSEFNFYSDPEAAHIVLENFTACPLYILPWETCMRSAASRYTFRMNTIGVLNCPLVSLLNKVEAKNLSKNCDFWVAPDAVIVACFLNDKVMRKTEHYHCSVELQGKHTRGMMIVDKNFVNQRPANVILITDVDLQAYEAMLIGAMENQRDYNAQRVGSVFKLEQNYF